MAEPSLLTSGKSSRNGLRKRLRGRRRALSQAEQRGAARALKAHLLRRGEFLRARRVAFYWPADGEIDPRPLLRRAWRMGKACYLPCLARWPNIHLNFVRYRPGTRLRRNGFGIPEPGRGKRLSPAQLDMVLMPLVGFDRRGNRLGMGGGFYDRTLAALPRGRRRCGPLRVGLAHRCQEEPSLPVAHWDLPLHWVVTDGEIIRCDRINRLTGD